MCVGGNVTVLSLSHELLRRLVFMLRTLDVRQDASLSDRVELVKGTRSFH